jgi:hypothetical protein
MFNRTRWGLLHSFGFVLSLQQREKKEKRKDVFIYPLTARDPFILFAKHTVSPIHVSSSPNGKCDFAFVCSTDLFGIYSFVFFTLAELFFFFCSRPRSDARLPIVPPARLYRLVGLCTSTRLIMGHVKLLSHEPSELGQGGRGSKELQRSAIIRRNRLVTSFSTPRVPRHAFDALYSL